LTPAELFRTALAAINSAGIKDFGCINKGTRITEDKASPGN